MRNKLIYTFFAVCFIFCIFTAGASAVEMGDVDADGKVTAKDARLALRCSVELEKLTADEFFRADMNGDGKIFASDARAILRISVQLSPAKLIENQYDMLRSGIFTYKAELLNEQGKYDYFELTKTKNTLCVLTNFENTEVCIFVDENNEIYLVSHDKKAYLHMNDAIFNLLGEDKNSLISGIGFDGSKFLPLKSAVSVKDGVEQGFSCKIYTLVNGENTSEVYMCGSKLIRIKEFDSNNVLINDTYVYDVSMTIPENRRSIPDNYKKYEGIVGFGAFSILLGAG